MRRIVSFLNDFYRNSGFWIGGATMINKLILFVISAYIVVLIPKTTFGELTYVLSVVGFVSPFGGLGVASGLLRFGSIAADDVVRKRMVSYSFWVGSLQTWILIGGLMAWFYFLMNDSANTMLFLCILSFRIYGLFVFSIQCVNLRIHEKNRWFSWYEIANSVGLLLMVWVLTTNYSAVGYVWAMAISPLLVFGVSCVFFGFPKWNIRWGFKLSFREFWKYSLFSSFANVVSQLVFFLDIFLIDYFLTKDDVAEYRVAALIPINLLILPMIFMKTDFTKISKNFRNRTFIATYYSNYFLLFLVISVLGLIFSYFVGEWMFGFIGAEYQPFRLFMILMLGACSAMLLRVPLGNMIAAFGKIQFNTVSALVTILIDFVLNILLIPRYGLEGAAWATSFSLLLSGLFNLGYFVWYLQKETLPE